MQRKKFNKKKKSVYLKAFSLFSTQFLPIQRRYVSIPIEAAENEMIELQGTRNPA